ncbi:helix-turn-helix domain-containing protein [Mitsuaria sp. 7]|uniref:helix-turn-helix domain-containing protein n=1 Tax=Mitsuaria sp. 7 TaxID=1658665 RepID=UPI0007DDB475|nr:helix-turn-helix transcriptional regulator [Mitsuaria sp. 7]ANH68253.1 hypothetical protein ABE85_13020 [Mitsuaria sp. 7]
MAHRSPLAGDPALLALGAAVRRIREAKGISQERLALEAQVDRSYVSHIETGKNNPAVLTLVKLAGAMDVSVADLVAQAGL